MRIRSYALMALAIWLSGGLQAAEAQTCTREAFRKIVDDAGAALRQLHATTQPQVQAGFRRLKEKNGWSEDDYLDKANEFLVDDKTEAFDAKASELLSKLDKLADDTPAAPGADCPRLTELEATSLELQATVRAKTTYILRRLDQAAAAPSTAAATPPAAAPAPVPPVVSNAPATPSAPPTATQKQAANEQPKSAPIPKIPPSPPPLTKPKAGAPEPKAATTATSDWSTRSGDASKQPQPSPRTSPQASASPPAVADAAPAPGTRLPPVEVMPGSGDGRKGVIGLPPVEQADGFSKDEIQEASRGLFGTVSSGLANVIEHAFSKMGRPSGYVVGSEGGGAFLAGLRYGKGTLYLRSGETREVHWHGPSIGYDIGAAGSKTLFLVYNLHQPLDIFAGFSGVDGSAFLVGGVGMTLLTNGKVVMAPIRSGLGLRLGANIGYLRFTAQPTWNPF